MSWRGAGCNRFLQQSGQPEASGTAKILALLQEHIVLCAYGMCKYFNPLVTCPRRNGNLSFAASSGSPYECRCCRKRKRQFSAGIQIADKSEQGLIRHSQPHNAQYQQSRDRNVCV